MNATTLEAKALTAKAPDEKLGTIIKLAILAVGGQGGGVLTNWIEATARARGYACQATSVAGVAQRTGATIYYIEMAPMGDAAPVFSLAPAAGDVDIMIAAEMMEAGRAILRGFVTPDRTALIASTHRALAVSEKMVPGDGIASSEEVRAAAEIAAETLIMFDMDALAIANGSVISATLFGALAGSGALPFPREAFEDAIRASGKGVAASLRAFDAGFTRAQSGEPDAPAQTTASPATPRVTGPEKLLAAYRSLEDEARATPAPEMALAGLRKVTAFQDVAYGREYLDRLKPFLRNGPELSETAAKYIANAMTYDDVIRVADAKTRPARFSRIRSEMGAGENPVRLTEFMHPRAEEIVGLMPARLGARVATSPRLMRLTDRLFNRSRRLRPHRLSGFLALWFVSALRPRRRGNLRHAHEQASLNEWLSACEAALARNPALAIELLRCRRLVKGYSDTHLRGTSKFARVMEAAKLVEARDDAPQWIARLRDAALADEEGKALDGAIRTIRSFA